MRNTRRLTVLATAVIATALALAGCGGSKGSVSDQQVSAAPSVAQARSSSGYSGTLNYWVLGYQPGGGGLSSALMDKAVAIFEKANPDITVKITGYTGDDAGNTKLTQAVKQGGVVDVLRLPSDLLPNLVAADKIAPVDDQLTAADKSDYVDGMVKAVTINGHAYAWPLWVPPVGMYVNTDLFKQRGVPVPTSGWTYAQFVATAKKMTFKKSDGTQVYGYDGLIDPGVVNTWPFILGDGATPTSSDGKTYSWDSAAAASGLKKLVDLARVDKVTPPDFGTQTVDEVESGFQSRKIYAMYSEPSGFSSTLATAKMNFTVVGMPVGASGKQLTAGGIGLISVAKNSDAKKQQAGQDLARWLTSTQVGSSVPGFYLAPGARRSVSVSPPISLFKPLVSNVYIPPEVPGWPNARKIIHTAIQKAVLGQVSPDTALKQIAPDVNKALASGG